MGRALEVICGQVTAPSTTLAAWTMNTGNSLTVRSTRPEARIHLLTAWGANQGDGELRIVSPRLHDNVNCLRFALEGGEGPNLLVDPMFKQRLYPQDALVVTQSGSATCGDIELGAMLFYYEDLPGVDARLASPEFIRSRMQNLKTVPTTLNSGTTGNYSGEQTLVADFSELKANHDYALLGYTFNTSQIFSTIRIRGNDSGNLGIGMPAFEGSEMLASNWFEWLSTRSGLPCIPIFQSANGTNILVDVHCSENDANPNVNFLFAELGPTAAV